MDPKHQENYLNKYDEKSLEKLQSRIVFTDPVYSFVFKKTEKIVAALYLITNLISDIEPIKWQIRKTALGLVSDTLSLKRSSSLQTKQIETGLAITISEIVSLLKIASIADHISSMNSAVVQRELTVLMDSLQSLSTQNINSGAIILPQDFFNVPAMVPTNFSAAQPFSSKGQYRASNGQKDNKGQQPTKDNKKDNPKDNLKDIKNDRHEKMLQLLKAGKPLGIKDFANEIKDCSEKTLQRELLNMVESGVLKKTGERRWSLYSLV